MVYSGQGERMGYLLPGVDLNHHILPDPVRENKIHYIITAEI